MRVSRSLRRALSLCTAALIIGSTPAVGQFNQFEIKEPKVEKGEVEIGYLGDYSFGPPRRRFIEGEEAGSFLFDDNEFSRQRHTLELGYGLTRWLSLQVGVEANQERFGDAETVAKSRAFDELQVTEVQIEGMVVLVPAGKQGFGAAALIEHNIAIDRSETDQLFLGTALQYAWGPWSATANLYAVKHLGGREELNDAVIEDERWDVQYAAQVKYQVNEKLALAVEGYGIVERLGNSGTKSDERQAFGDFDRYLLGPAFYYSWGNDNNGAARKRGKGLRMRNANADSKNGNGDKNGDDDTNDDGDRNGPSYTLGAGALLGLNENTADVVLKWSLGVDF